METEINKDPIRETPLTVWMTIHQPSELNYWKGKISRFDNNDFYLARLKDFKGHPPLDFTAYKGKLVVDMGSGPRSICEFFEGADVVCIEPLAEEFRKINNGAYDKPMIKAVIPQPAEGFISKLAMRADLVWCNNVLDHCFNWRSVLMNIARYLRPGGDFFIALDNDPPHAGHPGIGDMDELIRTMTDLNLFFNYFYMRKPTDPDGTLTKLTFMYRSGFKNNPEIWK